MATLVDTAQLIVEESPRYEGAPLTAPYRLSSNVLYMPVQEAGLEPGPLFDSRGDEVRGLNAEPPGLIDGHEVSGALNMRAYANALPFLLTIAGWSGAFTAGDGIITDPDANVIPVGASRWVFTKRTGNVAKTAQLTLAYADEAMFVRGQGVGISTWSLNAAGAFQSTLAGLVYGKIADPSLVPSYDSLSIPHFRRGDLSLTWLGGGAAATDFSMTFPNPIERYSSLGLASPSFFPDLMEHGDEIIVPTGSIPKRSFDETDLDALMAGTTFAAEARWSSPKMIGATAYPYRMWIEMPACQYTSLDAPSMRNVRRFPATFGFKAALDEVGGYDARITIVNAVAAVETYA